MATPPPVISVDGPSAAGKGTLSRLLAHQLNFHYLDSGALYRIAGLLAIRSSTFPAPDELAARLASAHFRMQVNHPEAAASEVASAAAAGSEAPVEIYLDDEPVTTAIRDEQVSNAASRVAAWQEVRLALRAAQHDARISPGLVADGRDMGTQIFPDARPKFFLTASLDARALRRHRQLQAQPDCPSLDELRDLIASRDKHDETRGISPFKPAPDAIHLDSTKLTATETLTAALKEVRNTGLLSN